MENTGDDIDVDVRKITTKMNRSLKRLVDIPLSDDDDNTETSQMAVFDWTQPTTYGLSNSEKIVPYYFINKTWPLSEIPFTDIIKDDIRNMRPLNKYEMEYMKTMSNSELLEMIDIMEKVNRILIRLYDANNG